jgi:predicted nucleic acid-binding protein
VTSYVLDASVAAKWFLPTSQEPFAAEARMVLSRFSSGDCNLLVPDLFWSEIANILWKSVRLGRLSRTSCDAAVQTLERSGIRTFPTLPLLKDALAIALTFNRPIYDCQYLALAMESNFPMLTADERLANALGARFPIRWLGTVTL